MLFHSSIRKELARSFGATLIVLATVVMTMTLIRTLGQASRGSFNPSDVMLVMGYTVLAYMPTILTLSLFIAIISALSRMYRDSEMVIWFTSGRGLASLLRPLFRFAWPILGVIMALALLVLPWSNQKIKTLRDQYETRGDIERIEPGQFQESAGGNRVFFVEKEAAGQTSGANVFIATTENGKETVTSARSGRIHFDGQDQFLLLSNGQRLESVIGQSDVKISEFEEYGIKISSNPLGGTNDVPVGTRTTLTLLQARTLPNLAELSWRLGLVFAAINFVIIGIAGSSVNPRAGRSVNLIFSLFIFILYYNLLTVGQSWIASGKFTWIGFLLGLHGGALVFGLLWLAKAHHNWHWRRLLGRRTALASHLRNPAS